MTSGVALALNSFRADLSRHELFLVIEEKIRNPASARSRPRSETLLSAYIALSCGRFEGFLQSVFFSAAEELQNRIGNSSDSRIIKVDTFHWQNLSGFLHWAARAKGIDRADLVLKIQDYSSAIAQGHIFPESFKYTNANPNSQTLHDMFRRFGIEDCFGKLAGVYQDALSRHFTASLIKSTLDAFVKRRHEAAHNGRIVGLTRVDARQDQVFIAALADSIESVLATHISSIQ